MLNWCHWENRFIYHKCGHRISPTVETNYESMRKLRTKLFVVPCPMRVDKEGISVERISKMIRVGKSAFVGWRRTGRSSRGQQAGDFCSGMLQEKQGYMSEYYAKRVNSNQVQEFTKRPSLESEDCKDTLFVMQVLRFAWVRTQEESDREYERMAWEASDRHHHSKFSDEDTDRLIFSVNREFMELASSVT